MLTEPALASMQRREVSLPLEIRPTLCSLGMKAAPGAHDLPCFLIEIGRVASGLHPSGQRGPIGRHRHHAISPLLPFRSQTKALCLSGAVNRFRRAGDELLRTPHCCTRPGAICRHPMGKDVRYVEKIENLVF